MLAPYPFALRVRTLSLPQQSSPDGPSKTAVAASSSTLNPPTQPSSAPLSSGTMPSRYSKDQNRSAISNPPRRSSSFKHKILRLKRPSTVNTSVAHRRDFPTSITPAAAIPLPSHTSLTSLIPLPSPSHEQFAFPPSPASPTSFTTHTSSPLVSGPPPRPPRNPARATRPSTSSGIPHSKLSRATITRPFTASTTDILDPTTTAMPDYWASAFSRGSDFALQRRKSKSSKGGSTTADKPSAKNDVQFSTVDRTILEELRQKIRARESQFVIRNGRKHHPFPAAEAPYPRSYEREVVDHDVWNTMWMQQLNGSVTAHLFETAPARVLDIGCGTGTWILDAARLWKSSHFVGLDLVPLHPDLQQVGSPDLASRITWVQANFLEGLPFPNEEFDMVRVAWIARAVPEDKWDALFEEFTRVMKPGAAFELLEEDLYFPGKLRSPSVQPHRFPSPISPPVSPLERPRAPTPSSSYLSSDKSSLDSLSSESKSSLQSREKLVPLPSPRTPIAPAVFSAQKNAQKFHAFLKPPINPHDHSLLEYIYNEMHAARFINLQPLSLLSNLSNIYFKHVRTHPPLIAMFPPHPTEHAACAAAANKPRGRTLTTSDCPPDDAVQYGTVLERPAASTSGLARDTCAGPHSTAHWVAAHRLMFDLEDYVKVEPIRPSSLLAPRRGRAPARSTRTRAASLSTADLPSESEPGGGAGRGAPAGRASVSSAAEARFTANELPNGVVRFDLRSLNMHLSRKVREVLACAEAMWDFVVDYQTSQLAVDAAHVRGHAHPRASASEWNPRRQSTTTAPAVFPSVATRPANLALIRLTRSEFEDLLTRFELDMQDCMNLDSVVKDRIGWAPVAASRTLARKEFDTMCKAWALYEDGLLPGTASRRRVDERDRDGDEAGSDGPALSASLEGSDEDSGAPARDARRARRPPPSQRLSRTMRAFAAWKA